MNRSRLALAAVLLASLGLYDLGCSGSTDNPSSAAMDDGEIAGSGGDTPSAKGGPSAGSSASEAPTASGAAAPGSSTSPSPLPPSGEVGATPPPATSAGILTAGTWDDNINFERFMGYREAVTQAHAAGILPITKDEAGLATVMGHEIAHAVARHGGERMSRAMVIQGGGSLLGLGMQNTDPRWQAAATMAYGVGAKLGAELPHSRAQESEADRIGLIYMAQAGYAPEAAVDFWKRFGEFNKQQGGDTPWFLRTHPLDETRVKQLQGWIPEAKAKANAPK